MASGKYELWTVDCGLRTADSGHLAMDWVYSIKFQTDNPANYA